MNDEATGPHSWRPRPLRGINLPEFMKCCHELINIMFVNELVSSFKMHRLQVIKLDFAAPFKFSIVKDVLSVYISGML